MNANDTAILPLMLVFGIFLVPLLIMRGDQLLWRGLVAVGVLAFAAKKSKDKSTRGFIDFIFEQTKGSVPKNDIRYAIKNGGLPRTATVIKRTEIETYAKRFYGYEARLAKKAEKETRLTAMRERTAHNVRARREKSRAKKRGNEIERVAEFWNLPEIKLAKSVKHAHLIDKDLSKMAETSVEANEFVKIVYSPYL